MESRSLPGRPPGLIRFPRRLALTSDEFFELCRENRDWRFERSPTGEIIVIPPTGFLTGRRNSLLIARLTEWAERDGTGIATDSSTGFELPDGATRAPDAAWVSRVRLANLTPAQLERFLPLCPDFVVELRSPTDDLEPLQEKMTEYMANGAALGWLIDPEEQRAWVYRKGQPVERLDSPAELQGDPVLPSFRLDLRPIWQVPSTNQ